MYDVENELVKRQLIGVHKKLQAKMSRIHDTLDKVKGMAGTCQEVTPLADSLIIRTDELLDSVYAHLLILEAELVEPYSYGWGKLVFNVFNPPYPSRYTDTPLPADTPDKE